MDELLGALLVGIFEAIAAICSALFEAIVPLVLEIPGAILHGCSTLLDGAEAMLEFSLDALSSIWDRSRNTPEG